MQLVLTPTAACETVHCMKMIFSLRKRKDKDWVYLSAILRKERKWKGNVSGEKEVSNDSIISRLGLILRIFAF